jgi:hypothetical protein
MDKDKAEEININVKSQEGNTICFKLRKTTPLKKMIESYCSRNGVSAYFYHPYVLLSLSFILKL